MNLCCGLDSSAYSCDNGLSTFVNIDFPSVIRERERIIRLKDRTISISSDLKEAGINGVEGLFSIEDPMEIGSWSDRMRVSSKDYMTGYGNLNGFGIGGFYRFLSKLCNGPLKLRNQDRIHCIIRIY